MIANPKRHCQPPLSTEYVGAPTQGRDKLADLDLRPPAPKQESFNTEVYIINRLQLVSKIRMLQSVC